MLGLRQGGGPKTSKGDKPNWPQSRVRSPAKAPCRELVLKQKGQVLGSWGSSGLTSLLQGLHDFTRHIFRPMFRQHFRCNKASILQLALRHYPLIRAK